jgi:protein associated with RNAse G/E
MTLQLARIETFCYPDVPRYFFPAAIVAEQPDYMMIFHPAGSPVWSGKDGKLHRSKSHSLSFLYPDRDYNLILFWRADWAFDAYYVNIALPFERQGDLCCYIDLDLDVLWLTEHNFNVQAGVREAGVYILDREEYEERKVEYNYPPELMERAEAAVLTVLEQIEARVFPFDDSLLNWRPTPEMLAMVELPDQAALWHQAEVADYT